MTKPNYIVEGLGMRPRFFLVALGHGIWSPTCSFEYWNLWCIRAYPEEPYPSGSPPTHRIRSICLFLPLQRQSNSNSGSLNGLGLSRMCIILSRCSGHRSQRLLLLALPLAPQHHSHYLLGQLFFFWVA